MKNVSFHMHRYIMIQTLEIPGFSQLMNMIKYLNDKS